MCVSVCGWVEGEYTQLFKEVSFEKSEWYYVGQEEVVFQEQPVQRPRKGRKQELNSIFKELKDAYGDGVERES